MKIKPERLAIRCWAGGELLWIDRVTVSDDNDVPKLAEKHARALAKEPRPHMMEIEFLDEPDHEKRYFSFGTDPTRMVEPIKIQL